MRWQYDMKHFTGLGLVAMSLLLANSLAFAQETPLVVIKDSERRYSHGTEENIAKLEELIATDGSIVVWITLDPIHVGFSPRLYNSMSDYEKIAQDERTARELNRIVHPMITAHKASLVRRPITQFGHSGLIRINDKVALRHILSDRSVLIVSSESP